VARALGEFGAEAKMAVPFLQDLGRNPDLAGKINEVLVKIDPSAKVSTRVMDKLDTDLEDLL
jgi:hypothetical protein